MKHNTPPQQSDKFKFGIKNMAMHLKVFGIAFVFGLGAYAVMNIIYFIADFLGLNGS